MKIVHLSFEILNPPDYDAMLAVIEASGRVCYKSEPKGDPENFIRKIIRSGHHSVIEHVSITAKIVCDRGVSHELVRHRLCSFSQESTRYANYAKEKFGSEITVIKPFFWDENTAQYQQWKSAMAACESAYLALIDSGAKAQEARSVLPNSLKTDIIVTANIREWRHIFKLRVSPKAHPDIRWVMGLGLIKMRDVYPVFFEDLVDDEI